ncbi:MAG: nucleotidyl transferase AbiEii/AbiGii toxin family protein [Caldisericia bacterium]
MIEERLASIMTQSGRNLNPLFLRTRLKEALQDEVLAFVYNHPQYRSYLFTGGTCLRKLYGLPRLSEDLDFDVPGQPDTDSFAADLREYVSKALQYRHMTTRVSENGMSITLVFPVLQQLGLVHSSADSPNLLLRCDIAPEPTGIYGAQASPLSTAQAMFFVRAYDLPTLFASKLAVFVGRDDKRGSPQTQPFEGRDVFDLIWFLQQAQQQEWKLLPLWPRVFALLGADSAISVVRRAADKAASLDAQQVAADLRPFVETEQALEGFSTNLHEVLPAQLKALEKALLTRQDREADTWQ